MSPKTVDQLLAEARDRSRRLSPDLRRDPEPTLGPVPSGRTAARRRRGRRAAA